MTDLTTDGFNITRTQNHRVELSTSGLLPNTKHTVTVNGVDHGFATKQFGKDFGAEMISDADGNLSCSLLFEIGFDRVANFELPGTPTLRGQTDQLAGTAARRSSAMMQSTLDILFVSIDGSSTSMVSIPTPLLMTAGPVQNIFPIE